MSSRKTHAPQPKALSSRASSTKCFVKSFDKDFPSEMHFECKCSIHGLRCFLGGGGSTCYVRVSGDVPFSRV